MKHDDIGFVEDSRFKLIAKDAKRTTVFWVIYFLLFMGVAYF